MSTLKERIASAFSAQISSSDVAALIEETQAAIASADEAAKQAKSRALDPRIIDPTARTAMQDAEFLGQQLRAALSPLRERYEQVAKAEAYRRWLPTFEAIAAEQDALAQELEDLYRPFEAKIADLLPRIQQADREARAVNAAKPDFASGDGWLLRDTELVARGLKSYSQHFLSILPDLKFPAWVPSATPVWPPRSIPLGVHVSSTMVFAPSPGADWAAANAARNQARQDQAARVAHYHAEQAKQRKNQDNAALRGK